MKTYYVGMDVHRASIVMVVLNGAGKVVMQSVIETGAERVGGFLKQLRGKVYVTFEEGTQANWLHDVVRGLVTEVVVCDPRHNKLLQSGNKNEQLAALKPLRHKAKLMMVKEARRQTAYLWLMSVPRLGAVSVAQLIAVVGTPYRFRSKRQFWTYVGLAVVTCSSADHEVMNGILRRSTRPLATRGLNRNHNHLLKRVFKNAATSACHSGPFKAAYDARVAQGMAPSLARLTIARQLAATTLALWKRGEQFDPERKKQQAA